MHTRLVYVLIVSAVFLLLIARVYSLVSPKQPYFLWPNTATGDATVFFKDGTSKPIVTLWVGYAANKDITSVKTSITSAISKGSIPYIQSYSFGDDGLRGSYNLALEFDTQVAQTIGSSFAFVNLETEWDVDEVLRLFQTPEGTQSLANRVNVYRTHAPNAVVVSSPGLWKPTSSYSFFSSIDATLNARAILTHVVNVGDKTCSLKSDGSYWPNGASSLSNALILLDDTINSDLQKMNDAWGSVSPMEWIIADAGVTSCGWGESGQANILNVIVKNLDCLYKNGFRGFILRNAGPDPSERAMGINNEGMFTFTTSSSSVTILNTGLTRAKQLFISNQVPNCVPTETTYTLTISTGSNEYYAQVTIAPYSNIKTVTFTCSGVTSSMSTSSWANSDFVKSLSTGCPLNSPISVVINGNAKASLNYVVGTSVSFQSVITPSTSTVRPISSTVQPSTSTVRPSYSTVKPNYSTVKPNYSTVKPSTSTVKPNYSTVKPNYSSVKPNYSTVKPNSSTVKPISSSNNNNNGGSGTVTPISSGNSNRNTTVMNYANSLKSFNVMFAFALFCMVTLLLNSY